MADCSHERSAPRSEGLPLIPLAGWALAVLIYPAVFLLKMAITPAYQAEPPAPAPWLVSFAIGLLPEILLQGILRLHLALLSAAIWAIAIGAGSALLRRTGFGFLTRAERAAFGGAVGMGVLSLGTFLIGTLSGAARGLMPALLVVLLLAMAACGFRELLGLASSGAQALAAWRRQAPRTSICVVVLGAGIVLLALTRANVPVVADFDSLEYHLAAPAQWWREGHIFFLRDNVYSNFPQNVEMLFLLTMTCFGGPRVGTVVGLQVGIGFVILTAGAIAACGRRLHSSLAGRAGAAVFLTTPMLPGLVTLNSYVVELPLAAYGFLALFAFLLLRRAGAARDRWRLAALCGVMIGLAVGCKYPALLFVLAPILAFILAGGVLWPRTLPRALAEAAVVGAVALTTLAPWLIRNTVNTGNPTYPLLHGLFDGRNWTAQQEAKFDKAHRTPDASLVWQMIGLSRRFWSFAVWRGQPERGMVPPAAPLLVLLGLIPVALGDRRSTRAILYMALLFLAAAAARRFASVGFYPEFTFALVAAGVLGLITCSAFLLAQGDVLFLGVQFVLWLLMWHTQTHGIDRFLDPATPAAAALAGVGLACLPAVWPRRIAAWLITLGLAYAAATSFLMHAGPLWVGLTEPPDAFLTHTFEGSTYCQPAMDTINTELPADATVLFVGESRTFYCRRRVLAATVFDRNPIDRILEREEPGEPAERVREGLRALGVTHLYVNWQEIGRLGSTYAYRFEGQLRNGFSDHITRALFDRMAALGYLRTLASSGPNPRGQPDFILYELQ